MDFLNFDNRVLKNKPSSVGKFNFNTKAFVVFIIPQHFPFHMDNGYVPLLGKQDMNVYVSRLITLL